MRDIQTREDIQLFSDLFYQKLLADDRVAYLFENLNMEAHMTKIYDFWEMILLGNPGYKNNMMEAHRNLVLQKEHFPIWLRHFEATLREHFEGDKTDEAISRANTIAMTMRYKLLGS